MTKQDMASVNPTPNKKNGYEVRVR